MKTPILLPDGSFDLAAEWECEHCKKKLPLGETALSWCLNIICDECAKKEGGDYEEEESECGYCIGSGKMLDPLDYRRDTSCRECNGSGKGKE